jgi:uncharacterized RDD family membrane protein YckC
METPPPASPPPPGPEGVPGGYTGPVPPGGWQTPLAQPPPQQAWAGAPLASWGSRFGAWVIDALVLAIPGGILFFVLVAGAIGISGDDSTSVAGVVGAFLLWFVVMAIVALLYAPLLMARAGAQNGRTWGKQMVGIRVVRDDGRPVDFGFAALREIVLKQLAVGVASTIIPLLPLLLNYLWPLFDGENRALHDIAVGSHVLRA